MADSAVVLEMIRGSPAVKIVRNIIQILSATEYIPRSTVDIWLDKNILYIKLKNLDNMLKAEIVATALNKFFMISPHNIQTI